MKREKRLLSVVSLLKLEYFTAFEHDYFIYFLKKKCICCYCFIRELLCGAKHYNDCTGTEHGSAALPSRQQKKKEKALVFNPESVCLNWLSQ